MARSGSLFAVIVVFVCAGLAQAVMISPTAEYLRTRPYQELSTGNPIGTILAGDIEKASGIVPSVGAGLAVWADGRSGEVAIAGFDLTVGPAETEFLISVPQNQWQEGNPFAGFASSMGSRWVVYDSANVGVAAGDEGDIEGSGLPPSPTWQIQQTRRQRSPVFTNASQQTYLSWIDHVGTPSEFPGYLNTDIYTTPVTGPTPFTNLTNITAGQPAPRDSLAANGKYLVWQELRYNEASDTTSWDLLAYNLDNSTSAYIDEPVAGRNQIDPDISGNLAVWTQEEDPAGSGATNIYFKDLDSGVGPIAITTSGAAAKPAISGVTTEGLGEVGDDTTSYFVVWQSHDDSTSLFPGGNGETDYNWDIWAQELRLGEGNEWDLYMDPFLIRSDDGRQTNPDIDGLFIVWQSQAPDSEDIYVWGAPVPEPGTLLVLVTGIPALLARRGRLGKRRR